MNKQWIISLTLLLLSSITGHAVEGFDGPTWYDYRDTSLDINGRGTLDNPIVITTPEQLAQLSYIVNEENARDLQDKVIVLGADINLNKTVDGRRVQWIPIGYKGHSSTNLFYGIFLGVDITKINEAKEWQPEHCHTISGMYIDWKGVASTSTVKALGLFGCINGYVGNLTLTDAGISYHNSNNGQKRLMLQLPIGLLCGEAYYNEFHGAKDGSHVVNFPNQIYNVAVEGSITANRDEGTNLSLSIGGITGEMDAMYAEGIAHCAADVTIRSLEAIYAGGICGKLTSNADIHDCAASADITLTNAGKSFVGGIVGYASGGNIFEGCTSSGTINGFKVGGICGQLDRGQSIGALIACSSTARLSATNNVGGIIGLMDDSSYAKNEVKYCSFGGHVDGTSAQAAGGICGRFLGDTDLQVSYSLMVGTLAKSSSGLSGAIVGQCSKAVETIANCYYDQLMFNGNVTGSDSTHITVKPLDTYDLTSGDAGKVPLLNISDDATVGFQLQEGYYPMVFTKTEWTGKGYIDNNSEGMSTATKLLFDPATIDKTNTLYQPGAWLCALPAGIRRGDCAWDFVSTVSLNGKELTYEEPSTNRSIEVRTDHTMPASDILKIKDKTATAVSNGTTLLTIASMVSTSDVNLYHPKPIGGSKQVQFTITVDQPWDGSVATAYTYGKGLAEDPFIIKNGAQLAYAVLNNKAGEHFEQICDITLNPQVYTGTLFVKDGCHPWVNGNFNAHYDGCGHFIIGPFMESQGMGLFGHVGSKAEIENLGVVDANFQRHSGVFASTMDGHIINCIAQGFSFDPYNDPYYGDDSDKSYSGGFCSTIGTGNPEATIEDCISGVFHTSILSDFSPFVSLTDENKGKVINCLSVVSVISDDLEYTGQLISMSGRDYIKDCYWLKGYEQANTGYTLDEICSTLGKRKLWTFTPNYFPSLRTFAETDMGKLMSVPFRTDIDYHYDSYRKTSDNFLMGFSRQIQFEPASVDWKTNDTTESAIEWDSEMGIVVPVSNNYIPGKLHNTPHYRQLNWLEVFEGKLGKFTHRIMTRTDHAAVNQGITFVDINAQMACLDAFDTNNDSHLSLAELKAATNEQTLTAFQTATARKIVSFPEFRFFKNVSTLTSQLNGLEKLKNVRLPYDLKTLGTEAFKGCSSLKEVTIPSKMTKVEPRSFYGSSVDSIFVDPFNAQFESRDGVLFAKDANAVAGEKNVLAAFPNGRNEVVISGTVSRIANGAVYKVPGVSDLYFDTTDYTTVPQLENGGIETEDGQMMHVYVCDATKDSVLLRAYRREPTWSPYVNAGRLSRYYPLKIDTTTTAIGPDGQRYHVGTFYIGFDTELPATMTPYIVSKADTANFKAYLLEQERQVPRLSPVVVLSKETGLYRLHPLGWQVAEWPMWANQLIGTDRTGMPLYQQHSAQGSILTPQNSGNQFGFFYDKQTELPPYHAYITYNTVGKDEETARKSHYDAVYDLEIAANDFSDGDFRYRITHKQSNNDYMATLTEYTGKGGCVVVPPVVDWEQQSQVPVTKMGPGVFSRNENTIYSIDMTTLEDLETVSTDRTAAASPFSGVDPRTIIYLPEGKATEADNVVVGALCKKLSLTDHWDFVPPYEFYAEEATYDRKLSATKNADGTWSSKAFTLCLPYDFDLTSLHESGQVRVCQLYYVKDNSEFIFSHTDPYLSAGRAYLIVVNEGELSFDAEDVLLVGEPDESQEIFEWDVYSDQRIGVWKGTFRSLSNDECNAQPTYGMDREKFRLYRNDTEAYRNAKLSSFRSAFYADNPLGRNAYAIVFKQYVAGSEDDPIVDFPTDGYEPDSDFSGYDDSVGIIHVIDDNGSHQYFDLQGRALSSPPQKGVYISNGKKIIK